MLPTEEVGALPHQPGPSSRTCAVSHPEIASPHPDVGDVDIGEESPGPGINPTEPPTSPAKRPLCTNDCRTDLKSVQEENSRQHEAEPGPDIDERSNQDQCLNFNPNAMGLEKQDLLADLIS